MLSKTNSVHTKLTEALLTFLVRLLFNCFYFQHSLDLKKVIAFISSFPWTSRKYLEKKGEELSKKGLQLQPHVVVLSDGFDFGVNAAYYACVHSSMFYATATLMEAVCLKSAFVFGLAFPAPSHASWTYLQRAVYGVTTHFDRVSSKVLELVTDIS